MQQQGNVRVKTYYGATPDESARQFQADAAEAAVSGFSPTSQAWNGPSLTVTYLYTQQLPSRQPVPAAWNLAGIAVVVAGILGAVGAALPWAAQPSASKRPVTQSAARPHLRARIGLPWRQ
jgi:hypothetical protein